MSKGLAECDKCDYFISVEEAYQQGAKEFAEWLVSKNGYLDLFGNDSNTLLEEWKKGKENVR